MSSTGVLAVLARLKAVLGVTSDAELAAALATSPQTVSSWKRRESVPYALCVEVSDSHGISLDWLLKGEGMQRPISALGEGPRKGEQIASEDKLTPREQAILGLLRGLDEADQRDIQSAAEEKKRLRQIEQRLQELTNALAVGAGRS